MNLTLTYDGKLKANGDKKHKHDIRKKFHPQLLCFWESTQFNSLKEPSTELLTIVGEHKFFPLVSRSRNEIAELKILMLRPEIGGGSIIRQGGDIDNRLKTLFDALRMPNNTDEMPSCNNKGIIEAPFFCLLQDDILITSLSISTDRLLGPYETNQHVKLIIRVQIKQRPMIGANMIIT